MPYLEEYRGGGLTTLPNDNTVPMVYSNGEYVPAYFLGGLLKKIGSGLKSLIPAAIGLLPGGGTAMSIIKPVLGGIAGMATGQGPVRGVLGTMAGMKGREGFLKGWGEGSGTGLKGFLSRFGKGIGSLGSQFTMEDAYKLGIPFAAAETYTGAGGLPGGAGAGRVMPGGISAPGGGGGGMPSGASWFTDIEAPTSQRYNLFGQAAPKGHGGPIPHPQNNYNVGNLYANRRFNGGMVPGYQFGGMHPGMRRMVPDPRLSTLPVETPMLPPPPVQQPMLPPPISITELKKIEDTAKKAASDAQKVAKKARAAVKEEKDPAKKSVAEIQAVQAEQQAAQADIIVEQQSAAIEEQRNIEDMAEAIPETVAAAPPPMVAPPVVEQPLPVPPMVATPVVQPPIPPIAEPPIPVAPPVVQPPVPMPPPLAAPPVVEPPVPMAPPPAPVPPEIPAIPPVAPPMVPPMAPPVESQMMDLSSMVAPPPAPMPMDEASPMAGPPLPPMAPPVEPMAQMPPEIAELAPATMAGPIAPPVQQPPAAEPPGMLPETAPVMDQRPKKDLFSDLPSTSIFENFANLPPGFVPPSDVQGIPSEPVAGPPPVAPPVEPQPTALPDMTRSASPSRPSPGMGLEGMDDVVPDTMASAPPPSRRASPRMRSRPSPGMGIDPMSMGLGLDLTEEDIRDIQGRDIDRVSTQIPRGTQRGRGRRHGPPRGTTRPRPTTQVASPPEPKIESEPQDVAAPVEQAPVEQAPPPPIFHQGTIDPFNMPRTAAQFTEAGDQGAADLMNRLNQNQEVESYLQQNSPPSFQEGGFLEEAGQGQMMEQVVQATITALITLQSNPNDAEALEIIQGFVDAFGESALEELTQLMLGSMEAPTDQAQMAQQVPPEQMLQQMPPEQMAQQMPPEQMAQQVPGMPMDSGGMVTGASDGMADEVFVTANEGTDQSQRLALSGGEWVVPADVVSGLGSGNTQAGGEVLAQLHDDVREQRTGSRRQAPQIDLSEVLPATYGEHYG